MPEEKQQGVKFDLTLNLGHILTATGMVGTIVALWMSFSNQVASQEQRLVNVEKISVEQQLLNKQLVDVITELRINSAVMNTRMQRIENNVSKIP